MSDASYYQHSPAERARLVMINEVVLAALLDEAAPARQARKRAGWDSVLDEIDALASGLPERMAARGESFDLALAEFVTRELRELAAEVRANLKLRRAPQWPN